MVFRIAACDDCSPHIEYALGSDYVTYEKSYFGDNVFVINCATDPRTAGDHSLFMQVWRQLGGTRGGSVLKCPHSTFVSFEFSRRRR
ncbi:hypothetical protein VTK73DRAFT_7004 [Phialemonium thermophilum]|uniref:Uncharacterized protein n=1 Tax=Phialemonium thermophilum TaxID=223376 RepID=A0ABR3WGU0_9PEZI